MNLTKEQKREVLETLAAVILSDVGGSELGYCCGDDEETVAAVQRFMEEVSEWLPKNHPSQRNRK